MYTCRICALYIYIHKYAGKFCCHVTVWRTIDKHFTNSQREITGRNCPYQLRVVIQTWRISFFVNWQKHQPTQPQSEHLTVISQQGWETPGTRVGETPTFRSTTRGSELSLQAVEGSHQSGNFTPGRCGGDEFQFWSAKRFAKIRWFKWCKGWWVFWSKESLCEINHIVEGST